MALSKSTPVSNRQGYLGGSDAAAVLGESPWRTRYALWCEKVGIEQPPNLDNQEFVQWGNLLEPIVAQEWARRTGKKIATKRQLLVHRSIPFVAGHIDRLVLNEKRAFLECKTTNAFDYRDWGPDGGSHVDIPKHYLAQVDHYMAIRDCDYCYVATLIGGNSLRSYRIERNAERETRLIEAETRFWTDHVVANDPPDITTEKDAKHRWREALSGLTVPVDQAARAKIVRLANVDAQLKPLKKEEKELRNWLFPIFQDREYVSDATTGELLARLTPYVQDHFDIDAARADKRAVKVVLRFTEAKPRKRLKVLI